MADSRIVFPDSASVGAITLPARSVEPTDPQDNAIYLDDGSNTSHGELGFRAYIGATWVDIGGGGDTAPFDDDTPILQDSADNTKQLIINVGGIATMTQRTWAIQNSDDTFVGRATTDTLTNKTLTSPTIGDFTNANHNHSNAANGGVIDASVISYTPAFATDWDGDADPGDVDEALDQLAERIDDLEATSAPADAQYLTLALDSDLAAERVLVANRGISLADGGANGNATLTHNFGAGVGIALASDVLVAGNSRNVIVQAESSTSDDLIEITGLTVGEEIWLRADAGDTITVKHNAGGATIKIHLYGNADVVLDEQNPLILRYVDTNVMAQVLDENSGGGGGLSISQYITGTYYNTSAQILNNSTSYVDTDGTNLVEPVTLAGGETVLMRFDFTGLSNTGPSAITTVRLVADSTADDSAFEYPQEGTAVRAVSVFGKWTGLGAGTFDFKPQWKTSANNAVIPQDYPMTWEIIVLS